MKTRLGLVSNSSVSSFICEVCGESVVSTELGLDICGMIQCINGHTICEEEITNEEYEISNNYELEDTHCPICQFEVLSEDDLSLYLEKLYKVERKEVFEEIKKSNKRRKILRNNEYNTYVCSKFNLQRDVILETIKTTYIKYDEFMEFLRQ
jgi:hypothetical protein